MNEATLDIRLQNGTREVRVRHSNGRYAAEDTIRSLATHLASTNTALSESNMRMWLMFEHDGKKDLGDPLDNTFTEKADQPIGYTCIIDAKDNRIILPFSDIDHDGRIIPAQPRTLYVGGEAEWRTALLLLNHFTPVHFLGNDAQHEFPCKPREGEYYHVDDILLHFDGERFNKLPCNVNHWK